MVRFDQVHVAGNDHTSVVVNGWFGMPLPNVRGIPAGALAAVPAKASRKNAAATIASKLPRVWRSLGGSEPGY